MELILDTFLKAVKQSHLMSAFPNSTSDLLKENQNRENYNIQSLCNITELHLSCSHKLNSGTYHTMALALTIPHQRMASPEY